MITGTLTGARRYRVHKPLFGGQLMVLQVEVRKHGWYLDPLGGAIDVDQKFWRDARPEDITRMETPQ